MNRRTFLSVSPLLAWLPKFVHNAPWEDDNEAICKQKFDIALKASLGRKPIGDVVVEIGKTFIGTDYVAHALEVPGEERLVINMRGLDCVSFYENALVLARCVKKNKLTFEDYKAELQLIRYRNGKINGYPSRLHYTSDYIHDNEKKGIWRNVTRELGGVRFMKTVNFMSTHPENYRQLNDNPEFLKIIKQQEMEMNAREMFHIPKEQVAGISDKLANGDIIGITTDIEGLDTSHTGIVARQKGKAYLLHAPLAGKKVMMTDKTLDGYLAANKRQIGIMVARPLEPVA